MEYYAVRGKEPRKSVQLRIAKEYGVLSTQELELELGLGLGLRHVARGGGT